MSRTADMTSTGARNIPSASSRMDNARKQAHANNCAVMYRGSHSWRTAMPTDCATGDLNLYYSGSYESVMDELAADGWKVEVML